MRRRAGGLWHSGPVCVFLFFVLCSLVFLWRRLPQCRDSHATTVASSGGYLCAFSFLPRSMAFRSLARRVGKSRAVERLASCLASEHGLAGLLSHKRHLIRPISSSSNIHIHIHIPNHQRRNPPSSQTPPNLSTPTRPNSSNR